MTLLKYSLISVIKVTYLRGDVIFPVVCDEENIQFRNYDICTAGDFIMKNASCQMQIANCIFKILLNIY